VSGFQQPFTWILLLVCCLEVQGISKPPIDENNLPKHRLYA